MWCISCRPIKDRPGPEIRSPSDLDVTGNVRRSSLSLFRRGRLRCALVMGFTFLGLPFVLPVLPLLPALALEHLDVFLQMLAKGAVELDGFPRVQPVVPVL